LEVPEELPVRLHVTPAGIVDRVEIEGGDLDPELVEAVRRWSREMRFAPARRGGSAVEGWFSMTFVFRD
jgi:TonB family protein